MKNYKIQNGCHNCKNCFILTECDSNDEYYCTKDAPSRPRCGSSHLDETFDEFKEKVILQKGLELNRELTIDEHVKLNTEVYIHHSDILDNWSKDRKVENSGICDNWEIGNEES